MQHSGSPDGHLQRALNASGIGSWHFDPTNSIMSLDAKAQELFGYQADSGTTTHIFSLAHGRDGAIAAIALQTALQLGIIDVQYHNVQNQMIWVKGSRDGDYLYGTVQSSSSKDVALSIGENPETLNAIISQSNIGIGLYVGRELVVGVANSVILNFWGKGIEVIGQTLEKALPELEGQPFLQILDDVFTSGQIYQVSEAPVDLAMNGVFGTYYFDFMYKPLFNNNNEVYAILNTAIEVTDRVFTKRKMQASEARFRAVTEQSPMAIGLLTGKDMVVEIANERLLNIWGKDTSVINKPLIDAIPEIEGQGFLELLDGVYTTDIPHHGYETPVKLEHNNVLTDFYVDFTYSALKNENGENTGVLVLAIDATERVNSIRKIAESEARFKAVIYSAQAAMAVFKGRNALVADIANDAFLKFVGRSEHEFVGLPLLESMPEMEGQASIGLMHEVFDKGIKTHHYGRQVNIMRNGELHTNFYNVSYTPLFDANGEVYAVLDIAIDVTETIKTQKAIVEAEASLRGAVELAELGTWSLDPETRIVTYSDRMLEWYGFSGKPEDVSDVYNIIHENDRERIVQAIVRALDPGSDGIYDEEYAIINRLNGRERILHAQGKAFFDADGKPYQISGTAQDITTQKRLQLSLENEVKERTEALQRANNELEEMNNKLINSNEELAQYAYVASHDLQEPLRKINMFSNMLKERDAQDVHKGIIDKIIKSSERMSLLIKDLLEFSRLLNPDTRFICTDLYEIVKAVKSDFELLIEERQADVHISTLPVIEAVPLQMNQLFYNLLGNAIKFVEQGTIPKIMIQCEKITHAEAAIHIAHPGACAYYRFTIADNGIGIEEQYQKQIFEVFKRLHSRSEYSGSGIGLAICRRIVGNHGGAIYINSVMGEGTAFHIILPEKQVI
ncbi:PAS domain S-box protein [Flavobacterium zepuense]|uniref:histidine kinase n=1 Tax=Flavobacterium zepuense TaxID=2593302 RepID=A0A552V1K7_9FLAO|nr:PAS domain S-box protein [Flavobacterium zepuense]TRW24332.1 PAS domain S-box protein [Flavobacterium zepuense]